MATSLLASAAVIALAGCGSTEPTGSVAVSSTPVSTSADAKAATPDVAPSEPGLVVYASNYSVSDTVSRVQRALETAGAVAATVDFEKLAQGAGETIRPTTVVIGGNPKAASPLIAADQRAAIDLPQKYLVWQAANGTVFLAYNSAEYIATLAGIPVSSDALDGLRAGSASTASDATGSSAAAAEGTDVSAAPGYLVEKTSDASVAASIARYEAAFAAKNQPTVATVDLASAAAETPLRPTMVTYVGNPAVSTALVGAQQTMGIDLPARYVAWQDAEGIVHVAHPDIRVLAARHSISPTNPVLDMVAAATTGFTDAASGSGS
ncbi:DUF302 domain-containing protein [Rhodococcus sp. BP-349]|jgi:uncharacterized protein (DUF302 family)|uniref:DUF302 domain-containing protein n=2 Tax=Mycobacteriales TaxID=85007 RepID=A0A917FR67_9NOCA|nr:MULTISPECIES: DUF302 domain-containing protein [unclassified Rhodococcus (in: high G+C Gram-positive bacteria)]KQU45848.1 hypothetical protein ASG84_11130 [Rhodococcus sp. Leaf278]GGG01252.1 hypothetical protein GCM10007304_14030 [Rhodococcus trifolii]MBY6537598.1 DUF302 domain-containing protein [Rhodococcus sp. BP-363]MBY6541935.1 DUF302 domain-containing protein [Rhodococcus sp. BP-369]MBY6561165.1 DUF302 domain-containing protein [Rhodococcus sp. BP-370]